MLTMKELTDRAFALGFQAAERKESRAPALNEEFMTMMRESTGVDWTPPLQAYVRGYQARVDQDADSGAEG
jgi:hypothetical protein